MKWLNSNLCTFDELVRVELSPQIIKLTCNKKNLSNDVTHPQYKVGGRDCYGKIIYARKLKSSYDASFGTVEEGEEMSVIDWGAIHVPYLWTIYKWGESSKGKFTFIKVAAIEDKKEALAAAKLMYEGMK